MNMQNSRNARHSQPKQERISAPGEAELTRYARVLSKYKVDTTVLREILEQYRARRQIGWERGSDVK